MVRYKFGYFARLALRRKCARVRMKVPYLYLPGGDGRTVSVLEYAYMLTGYNRRGLPLNRSDLKRAG